MTGDFTFRFPAQEEANAYANAGADVYVLYYDMDNVIDILTWEMSCCGVPHGSELIYVFNWIDTESIYTRAWENPLSLYIIDHYSSIINTGKLRQIKI